MAPTAYVLLFISSLILNAHHQNHLGFISGFYRAEARRILLQNDEIMSVVCASGSCPGGENTECPDGCDCLPNEENLAESFCIVSIVREPGTVFCESTSCPNGDGDCPPSCRCFPSDQVNPFCIDTENEPEPENSGANEGDGDVKKAGSSMEESYRNSESGSNSESD